MPTSPGVFVPVSDRLASLFLVLSLLLLAGGCMKSPDIPAVSESPVKIDPTGPTVLQDDGQRVIALLPNRLIVIVQELHQTPTVSTQVFVKTGSIYEQEHVGAGLSHFLEHLLSGGSTVTQSEAQANRQLGLIGAQTNASTGLDTVRYYINTTAGHEMQAIDLLSDWMQNSLIDEDQYRRERDVIQREFEMGQGDPARIFWKLTQQTRYRHHPARHPTIGYLDEFLTISRDGIADFYHRMYVPNNMVFVVVGDVDRQAVLRRIAQQWAKAQPRQLPKLAFPVEPVFEQPQQASAAADVRRPRLRLAWPGTKLAEPGDYALDVLSMVLGQGESSRLVQSVRDRQRKVDSITAYNMSFHWGQGYFAVDCEPAQNVSADDVRSAILSEIQQVIDAPVTDEQLNRAKRQVAAAAVFEAQTAQGLAGRLAGDLIATGDPDYLEHYVKAIERLTSDDLRQAAEKYLKPERLMTLSLLPKTADQPVDSLKRPPLEPMDASIMSTPVELDNQQLLARLANRLAPTAAQKRLAVDSPAQVRTLSNGLKVLVIRQNRLPIVAMQFYRLGGLLADPAHEPGWGYAASQMLLRGAAGRSAQSMANEIESLGASLSAECGNNSSFVRAACLSGDWPSVLAIQADVILHPDFPADEWQRLQPRLVAAIDRLPDRWSSELRQKFLAQYFGDHPWSQFPIGRREVIQAIQAESLKSFYFDSLSAQGAALAIVGDVDVEQAFALAEQHFGTLAAKPKRTWSLPSQATPLAAVLVQSSTAKPMAAVQIGYAPGMVRTNPDYPAMLLLGKVLCNFPSGRLDQALRGDGPGLVYAVGSGQMSGLAAGYFGLLFNCQPSQVDQSLARTVTEVDRLKREPVDDETLARAKAALLAEEYFQKQTVGDRATEAALDELYGLGLQESVRFRMAIQSLTAGELQQVANAYLKTPVILVMSHQPLDTQKLHDAAQVQPPNAPTGQGK